MEKVFVIYEMRRVMDQVREIWASRKHAEIRVDELNEKYPNKDGFYVEEWDVKCY